MIKPKPKKTLAVESSFYPAQQNNCAIVLCINHAYWPHAAVVIRSILIKSPLHMCPIVIIYDRPDQAWISRIKRMEELFHSEIQLLKFDISIVDNFKVFGRLSLSTYFRLFAPRLLPNFSKLLYLDSDLVVVSDLSKLLHTDLGSYPIAARPLPVFDSTLMNRRLLRESTLPYFNAGVLLINTNLWEKFSCTDRITRIICDESDRLCYADQCALNLFFGDNYKLLPLEWNITRRFFELPPDSEFYSLDEIVKVKQALSEPKVIHYTGDFKPWHIQCDHPLRHIYWKHRSSFHSYPYAIIMRACQLGLSIKSKLEYIIFVLQKFSFSVVGKVKNRWLAG